jgi:hypothetical protein
MKNRNAFLTSILLLTFNVALSKDGNGDSPEVAASVAVLSAKFDVAYNYQFCRGRAGDSGYQYDFVEYIWQLQNRPYIQLSEKIFSKLSGTKASEVKQRWQKNKDKMLSERMSIDKDGNAKYCAQYFSQLVDGAIHKLNIEKKILAIKLGSTDEVRILERNIGMEVGCMKAGYNGGVKQFGEMKKGCDCQTSLVVRKMSNQEIDEYLQLASSKSPQEAAGFISKKIDVPELQACYGQLGAR